MVTWGKRLCSPRIAESTSKSPRGLMVWLKLARVETSRGGAAQRTMLYYAEVKCIGLPLLSGLGQPSAFEALTRRLGAKSGFLVAMPCRVMHMSPIPPC